MCFAAVAGINLDRPPREFRALDAGPLSSQAASCRNTLWPAACQAQHGAPAAIRGQDGFLAPRECREGIAAAAGIARGAARRRPDAVAQRGAAAQPRRTDAEKQVGVRKHLRPLVDEDDDWRAARASAKIGLAYTRDQDANKNRFAAIECGAYQQIATGRRGHRRYPWRGSELA